MYYLHKNFTNMLQKLAKTCATFSYFFSSSIFLRNKLWICDGKSNVFPPSPEREREKLLELDALRSSAVEIVFSQNSIETSIILFLHQLFIKYVLYIYGFQNLMWAVA